MKATYFIYVLVLFSLKNFAQPGFNFKDDPGQKKTGLLYNGKLLTAYCYFDSTEKPVLFPLRTLKGTTVTRGWPVAPRTGERTDHPHHVGLWFNYESVNGLDFWNNSDAIPEDKKHLYGSIRHQRILARKTSEKGAILITYSHWVDENGNILLGEETEFYFTVNGQSFIIDRKSTLEAKTRVEFKDVKDGMLGLRVARELEMPSTQEDRFVDSHGNIITVAANNPVDATGMYVNREGEKGDECWGKRSAWTYLRGEKDGERIMIVMIDHPENIGYPTYWHARGYGLFAANPLGQEIFSKGKQSLRFHLDKGSRATFQYRIIIHSGDLDDRQIDAYMSEFSERGKQANKSK